MMHTTKPSLIQRITKPVEQWLKDVLAQLDRMHGVGVVLQNERGGLTAVRINTSTGYLEYWDGDTWRQTN